LFKWIKRIWLLFSDVAFTTSFDGIGYFFPK
jgi:hypothetical protein